MDGFNEEEERRKIEGLIRRAENLVERFTEGNNRPIDLLHFASLVMVAASLRISAEPFLKEAGVTPYSIIDAMRDQAGKILVSNEELEEDTDEQSDVGTNYRSSCR